MQLIRITCVCVCVFVGTGDPCDCARLRSKSEVDGWLCSKTGMTGLPGESISTLLMKRRPLANRIDEFLDGCCMQGCSHRFTGDTPFIRRLNSKPPCFSAKDQDAACCTFATGNGV